MQEAKVEEGEAGGQAILEQKKGKKVVKYVGLLNSHGELPYAVTATYAKEYILQGRTTYMCTDEKAIK